MTTNAQIEIANKILETGLLTKVYHSCQALRDEVSQKFLPVYRKGAQLPYVGIDDTKGFFAYIRANGDMTAKISRVGSCENAYDIVAPFRVVFYNDKERRSFEHLIAQLSVFTFLPIVKLNRIINDAGRLLKEEQPNYNANFDGQTFYVAFDITVSFVLLPNTCEQDLCTVYQNPVCK
jgi:hypothetical protein